MSFADDRTDTTPNVTKPRVICFLYLAIAAWDHCLLHLTDQDFGGVHASFCTSRCKCASSCFFLLIGNHIHSAQLLFQCADFHAR